MVAGALGRGLVDVGAQALTSDRIDRFLQPCQLVLVLYLVQAGSALGKVDTRSGRVKREEDFRGGLDRILTKGRELEIWDW